MARNTTVDHRVRSVAILLAVLGGLPPAVLYWAAVARVPSVTPEAARDVLTEHGSDAVLVDVRTPEEYEADHLEAARNWPYAQIMAVTSAQGVPRELRDKRLLLICPSGILSASAVRRLRDLGLSRVENVEGGMGAWVAAAEKPCALGLCRLRAKSGQVRDLPARPSTLVEQWATVATGFVVKPLYTVTALLLVIVLWRQKSPDLAALRWGLIAFFIGENFCAANYVVYGDRSVPFEYLHSYGMVLCFALATYALLEGVDRRLLKLSDPDARCAALGMCRRCIKHADVPCGLRQVFLFLIPATMIVALAPLCVDPVPVSYNTQVFGTFYNYSHPVVHQVFEVRYLPCAAVLLLAVSLGVLWLKKRDAVLWAKVFFAAGMGAMGFGFFRLVLFQAYRDNLVWFNAWEELTELLFVLGVGAVLWVFRGALLPGRRATDAPAG